MNYFVGDDWSIDHHDIEIQDENGNKLAAEQVPESVDGFVRLMELISKAAGTSEPDMSKVHLCIEGERGAWTRILRRSGLKLYVINPLSASRFRTALVLSGAKSDKADAHALAELLRSQHQSLRPSLEDSDLAAAIFTLTRQHQKLTWDRTRLNNRLKDELRQYFPAAIGAYSKLTFASNDGLELLMMAPDPYSAAALDEATITAVLRAGHRRNIDQHLDHIMGALAQPPLEDNVTIIGAHAISVRTLCGLLMAVNSSLADLEAAISDHFRQHPDYEIYMSFPGVSELSGARLLAEYGDNPDRFATSKARLNYTGISPTTRQSGKGKVVVHRYIGNEYLMSNCRQIAHNSTQSKATGTQCHRFYHELIDHGRDRETALRRLACHLITALHACLKTHQTYDPTKAWKRYPEQSNEPIPAAA